jgi:8-oxo-dGTP pyrophosphatase MutT (NUDIX family)
MRHTARAIIIKDKQILLVNGHDADFYWTPGGGIEKNESALQALHRELQEELGVAIKSAKPYSSYSIKENVQKVDNFIVEVVGEFRLGREITKTTWFSKENFVNKDINISVGLATKLVPSLIKDGLL